VSESGELSVVTVVALVLGGLAALGLAVVVASKGSHRADAAHSGAAPPPSTEIEIPAELLYPVDAG